MNGVVDFYLKKGAIHTWMPEKNGFFAGTGEYIKDGERTGKKYIIAGNAIMCPDGEVSLYGEWGKYQGKNQFKAKKVFYRSEAAVIKVLLTLGYVYGVGPSKADSMYETLGSAVFQVLDDLVEDASMPKTYKFHDEEVTISPAKALLSVQGIGGATVAKIQGSWASREDHVKYATVAMRAGMSMTQLKEGVRRWGDRFEEVVKTRPYDLTVLTRFSWDDADILAMSPVDGGEKIPWNSPQRIGAAFREAIRQIMSQRGHMVCLFKDVVKKVEELAKPTIDPVTCINGEYEQYELVTMNIDGEDYITTQYLYGIEHDTAEMIGDFISTPAHPQFIVPDNIEAYADEGISLSQEQKDAVTMALENKFCVVTGGPGTGKTSGFLNTLLNIFDAMEVSYCLGAFTAKAAKRMSEATGREADTLHSTFQLHMDETNDLYEDVMIIDEASMNDALLMYKVFSCISPSRRIVIIGDIDQLPPIGPGEPMAQMLASASVPTTRLIYDFRNQGRDIRAEAAQKVLAGELPETNMDGGFAWWKTSKTADAVIEAYEKLLNMGYEVHDIYTLTPVNKTDAGQINLNAKLQKIANPDGDKPIEDFKFATGDTVLHTKNNRLIGAMNGMTGIVTDIFDDGFGKMPKGDGLVMLADYDDAEVHYTAEFLNQVQLGYVMTIHKSQGSENKAVIVAAPPTHPNFRSRQLIYTAMTRKSEFCVLIGTERDVNNYLMRDERELRLSVLAKLIEQKVDEKRHKSAA